MRYLGLLALSVVALGSVTASANETRRVSFTANPKAPELACPAAPRARPTPAPATPDGDPEVVPTEEDLGDLAHPEPVPRPTVDPNLVAGFALRADGGRVQPLRVGVWGDSHMASGVFSGELIRSLGSHGAEVETSYLPPTMGRSGVRLPIRKYCQATTWRMEPAYTSASAGLQKGPSLVDLRSTRRGAYLWLDFRIDAQPSRVAGVRVMYLPTATASTLGITLDNGTEQRIPLARSTNVNGPLRTADIEVVAREGAPLSTLKLRVIEGVAVLQGFMLTHREPRPVTMDVFGLPSATVRGWAQIEASYLKDALRGRSYDAVILQYGTNEGNDAKFDANRYSSGLATALEGLRAVFPDAACLLIGPTDRGVRIRKPSASRARRQPAPEPPDLMKFARIHRDITIAQAEVGKRYNCASWDWQAFMGGPASIYSWVLSTPPRAARDLTHLTPTGYRQSAAGLASALGWNGVTGN
jgi:hypothetical protein